MGYPEDKRETYGIYERENRTATMRNIATSLRWSAAFTHFDPPA
jgi:hypothetical protein